MIGDGVVLVPVSLARRFEIAETSRCHDYDLAFCFQHRQSLIKIHLTALRGKKTRKNGTAIRLLRPLRRLPQTRHRLFLRELLRRLRHRRRPRAVRGPLHERCEINHGVQGD
jgi:hypothetical protein